MVNMLGSATKMRSAHKKMSGFAFGLWLIMAVVVDLISLIPIINIVSGPVFIWLAKLTFTLQGYAGRGIVSPVTTSVIEIIPGVSALPGCVAFIVIFYIKNKVKTLEDKVGEKLPAPARRFAAKA